MLELKCAKKSFTKYDEKQHKSFTISHALSLTISSLQNAQETTLN
jgi:hypothetical protein